MHRQIARRLPRLLVLLLSGVLAVSLLGLQAGSAEATAGGTTTTTTMTGPTTATVGVETTLTAQVTPAGALGEVQFVNDDGPLGDPVAVDGAGLASLPYTFLSAGPQELGADFIPTPSSEFDPSWSLDWWDLTVYLAPGPDPDPEATTTLLTVPASAEVGTPVTLAASVSPAVNGTMQFSVNGTPAGSAVTVTAGAASVSHTFSDAGTSTVQASFTPELSFAYVGSADTASVTVSAAAPLESAVEVTGPDSATAGEEATLSAAVLPADVPGTVTFSAGGTDTTVTVDGGVASAPHTFTESGASLVIARFVPAADSDHQSSVSAAYPVEVAPGATSASEPTAIDETEYVLEGPCAGLPVRSSAAPQVGAERRFFDYDPFAYLFTVSYNADFGWYNYFSANFEPVYFTVHEPCFGGRGERGSRAVETVVQCVPTESGYQCPFNVPVRSDVTVTASAPLPAELAGQRVTMDSSLSFVDKATGEVTVLDSETDVVQVPRRTMLTAKFAPVKRDLTSVQRGKAVAYRVVVNNDGVFSADKVRTCVRVGPGAEIRTAKGATVRGERACWTLATLRKGTSAVRTITVVAPRTAGDLTLRATVTPRKSQADVVRLVTALPIR